MNFLAFDTSRDSLTVALSYNDKLYYRDCPNERMRHSELFLTLAEQLLKEAEADIKEIGAFAAVVGPGSFTGIRIGISGANALAFSTGAKRVGITAFELMAYNIDGEATLTIEAGQGNKYVAYKKNGEYIYDFIEKGVEVSALGTLIEQSSLSDFPKRMADVVKEKIERQNFCDMLAPMYLRKSQAERNYDI
ncbi:MAG: tRNA (adenosine(37)-N6)-threonylcarbamoyltransferase complex dimerization subunit type 1 TsaB [Clostridiales bacterium]|nr:tRNA (adenosine(37)-N6)-threonylcarbamoyltransferase complex dimerization subunit type 1 TsaB [Clostridiales bacterium]